MGMVNNLVKLPEISAQMQEMSKEMMKVRSILFYVLFLGLPARLMS